MAPRLPRPRPQKRQNFHSNQRYTKAPPRWLQQHVQMTSPAPWSSNPNNQLNEMEMELEVMRRQRQMLQEKRQLLEEQAELERMQNQQQHNPWADSLPYKPGPTSEYQAKRGHKRAGPAINFGQAKRSGTGGSEMPPPQSMEYQAAKDVGPVQLPKQIFAGVDTASRSILGRMELCLGHVLREMREQLLQPRNLSISPSQLKTLKQRIRERIHKMMMGKEIPESPEIHKMYRKLHTAKGDERLLSAVMEFRSTAIPAKSATPVKSEPLPSSALKQSPSTQSRKSRQQNRANTQENNEKQEKAKFIRMKLRVLMEEKMDGIFEKLLKLSSEGVKSEGATKSNGITTKSELAHPSAEPADAPAEPADAPVAPADVEAASTDGLTAPADKPAASDDASSAPADEPVADQPEGTENEESKETPDVMIIDPKEEEKKFIESEVLKALQFRLPQLLPRYKHIMVAILANDPVFIDLGLKAPEKLPELKKTKIYERLYHVKIMSKPTLPDRAVMKQFLDQFNTVSIKKHKAIYNLLFVGVGSLEDRQRLLEQSGTVVGGKTLDIRVSDKDKARNPENGISAAAAATQVENDHYNRQSDDQTKDGEEVKLENAMSALDSEINDLFQCISDATVPEEETATENPDETIEIPDDDGLDLEEAEVPEEDAGAAVAETQNEKSDNKNENADANGVVEIADDDSQEGTGIDDQKGKTDVEAAESKNEGSEQKSEDVATGIRTRRSSRIPQK